MKHKQSEKIILASRSPRRRELLLQAGFSFETEPAVGEEIMVGDTPEEIVMHLARQKAEEVAARHRREAVLVIGADTIVVFENHILGKPKNREAAKDMLSMLSGRQHYVLTGVCIKGAVTKTFYERTEVTFYPLTEAEIDAYIATGDCLDKAGAYGIQGPFAIHVKNIQGDYNNVVGLPVARLYHELNSNFFM